MNYWYMRMFSIRLKMIYKIWLNTSKIEIFPIPLVYHLPKTMYTKYYTFLKFSTSYSTKPIREHKIQELVLNVDSWQTNDLMIRSQDMKIKCRVIIGRLSGSRPLPLFSCKISSISWRWFMTTEPLALLDLWSSGIQKPLRRLYTKPYIRPWLS